MRGAERDGRVPRSTPAEVIEMKRVVVDHYGGPEVVKVVEDEDPRPAPGEARVRVLAAGVSFTDSQLRAGTYIPAGRSPRSRPAMSSSASSRSSGPDVRSSRWETASAR